MKYFLVILIFLFGCSPVKSKERLNEDYYAKLKTKYDAYVDLFNASNRFESGWLTYDCDSLLYNSIASISGVDAIDIEAAKAIDTNQWYRTPSKDCYSSRRSGSTISRDMFLGLFYWIVLNNRLDLITEIIDYGRSNRNSLGFWIMGDGDSTRIDIRSNMQATAHEIRYRLGGANHDARKLPQFWTKQTSGYATHLQFLHIYLRGLLTGEIEKKAFEVLKHHVKYQPKNALFQAILARYVDNNFNTAISILLDESLFPQESLPTNANYCTNYLWARDQETESWKPCDRNQDYLRGIDFIFAARIILGEGLKYER